MSTSGDQPTRPLTRRELRELRARGGESAVREALNAQGTSSADAPTGDTETPVAPEAEPSAAETLAQPRREPNVVATSSPDADLRPPLTRKELRRLRTNEVPIVTPGRAGDSEASERAESSEPSEESEADESSAAAVDDAADTSSDEDAASVDEPPTFDVIEVGAAESDDEPADAAVLEPTTSSTEIPTLDPSFGAGVGQRAGERVGPTSFDALMEQQYTQTSPSSIIMTSSLSLPEGIGSTGAAKGMTDGRDVDAVLIDGELPASSSPTPIAASAAISTQKSAHEVIRPPAPDKGRGTLLVLGITAGALGIVAIGTLATLYFTGVFN